MTDTCCIEGCYEEVHGYGMCKTHYKRWKRHGDANIVLPHRRLQMESIKARGPLEMSWREEKPWLAGIVDGEGSVCYARGSFRLKVKMTDEDVIKKVVSILSKWTGKELKVYRHEPGGNRQPTYTVELSGKHAVYLVVTKLYRFLCERRQGQIDAMIDERKQSNKLTLEELDL